MKDSDILRSAADVVLNAFTTGAYARTPDGLPTDPAEVSASCFCAVGATMRVMGGTVSEADAVLNRWVVPLLPKRQIHGMSFDGSVRAWNDEHTQQGVALMLVAGAKAAEAKGC